TRRVAGPTRIAKPHGGEHGRSLAAVLSGAGPTGRGSVRDGDRSRRALPGCEPGETLTHPGRSRRGDVRITRGVALRARAGSDRGPAEGDRPTPGVERQGQGLPG